MIRIVDSLDIPHTHFQKALSASYSVTIDIFNDVHNLHLILINKLICFRLVKNMDSPNGRHFLTCPWYRWHWTVRKTRKWLSGKYVTGLRILSSITNAQPNQAGGLVLKLNWVKSVFNLEILITLLMLKLEIFFYYY